MVEVFKGIVADSLGIYGWHDLPFLSLCLGSALILGYITQRLYRRSSDSNYTPRFAVYILLTPLILCAMVIIAKVSLLFTLIFVALMLLIRIKSSVKNLHQMAHLLMAILAGLGCGSGYLVLTFFVFGIIVVVRFFVLPKKNE